MYQTHKTSFWWETVELPPEKEKITNQTHKKPHKNEVSDEKKNPYIWIFYSKIKQLPLQKNTKLHLKEENDSSQGRSTSSGSAAPVMYFLHG